MREANTIIELTVKNHPGAMSHITGLFSRRAFNLEGILCAPLPKGGRSRMYLLVRANGRLEQIVRQLEKLYDVIEVHERPDYDHRLFRKLHELIKMKPEAANGR